MLVCERLLDTSATFDGGAASPSRTRVSRRPDDDLAACRHALEEWRAAYAVLRADYAQAVETAAALRESLIRARVRNRSCDAESARDRAARDAARAERDDAHHQALRFSAELQQADVRAEAQATRLAELHAQLRMADAARATQSALLRESDSRLAIQSGRGQAADGQTGRSAPLKGKLAALWRGGMSRSPTCAAQQS